MLRSACLAAALALAAPAADAQGMLGWSYTPRTAQEADALRLGIALYALSRDIRSGADLAQSGSGNRAALRQTGPGNLALVRQRGSDHSLDLSQNGRGNAQVVVQAGRGTSAQIVQQGTGQAGLLFLYGW